MEGWKVRKPQVLEGIRQVGGVDGITGRWRDNWDWKMGNWNGKVLGLEPGMGGRAGKFVDPSR